MTCFNERNRKKNNKKIFPYFLGWICVVKFFFIPAQKLTRKIREQCFFEGSFFDCSFWYFYRQTPAFNFYYFVFIILLLLLLYLCYFFLSYDITFELVIWDFGLYIVASNSLYSTLVEMVYGWICILYINYQACRVLNRISIVYVPLTLKA